MPPRHAATGSLSSPSQHDAPAGVSGGPANGPTRGRAHSYWSAWRMFSLEARLAGRIAASIPARIAMPTKTTSVTYGTANTTPYFESAVVVSTARNMPTPIPSAAPISAVTMLSCRIMRRIWRRVMPIARSIPSSRVRSKTDRTRVLMTPKRLTITDRPSSAYRICSVCFRSCVRLLLNSSRVSTSAAGNAARLFSSAAVFSVGRPAADVDEGQVVGVVCERGVEGRRRDRDLAERRPALGRIDDADHVEPEGLAGGRLDAERRAELERVVVGVAFENERSVPAELPGNAARAGRPRHVDRPSARSRRRR